MKNTLLMAASSALAVCFAGGASAGLIAWYEFEETSGSTVFDSSGNGNDLSYLGGGNQDVAGVFGNGIRPRNVLARTGGASSSTITNLNALTTNQVTISFWANVDRESIASNPFYVSTSSNSQGTRIFASHLEWSNGQIYWDAAWDQSGANRTQAVGGTVSDAYHHYVMTYDGDAGELFLYKDNVLLSSNTSAPGGDINWSSIRNFELGAFSFVRYWDGTMDDFAIWDEVLSDSNRTTAFTRGVAAVPSPTAALAGLVGLGTLVMRRRRGQ